MTEGRCNCSSIKVTIPALPDQSVICYCANCRRSCGSFCSIIYMFEKTEVTISDPNKVLKDYTDADTTSGTPITRQFCGNCGSPIASLAPGYPSKVILKGGLFDHIPRPGVKSFEKEQPEWMEISKA